MVSVAKALPTIEELLRIWERLIWRLSGQTARRFKLDPEDVRQELLLELVRVHHRYDRQWSFSTWVGLVHRTLCSRLAQRRDHSIETVQAGIDGAQGDGITLADMVADFRTPDPAAVAILAEEVERVRDAMANLEPLQSRVIGVCFFGETEGKRIQGRAEILKSALEAMAGVIGGDD